MKEFEKQDQELEQLVNNPDSPVGCGACPPDPELVEARKKICGLEWKLNVANERAKDAEERCSRLAERQITAMRFKALMAMIFKVLLCAGVSLLFAVILAKPEYVAPVAHLGIVIAGAVAAIHVDRFIRRH